MQFAGEGRHRRLDDSDSDSDSDGGPSLTLTAARASEKCPVPHRLIARDDKFRRLDDLSAFTSLDYVDLTNNSLSDISGLSSLVNLKTIIARGNRLTSSAASAALSNLPALRVLNLASNDLSDTDWLARASFAADITALVVNDNRVAMLDGIASLKSLETLVVSGNAVEDISIVRFLPRLIKLSASRNQLRALPEGLRKCHSLGEVRVSHNRIATLPGEEVLASLPGLRLLDLGHNRLSSVDALKYVAESLKSLNVAGNPAAKNGTASKETLLKLVPGLEVLDGSRFAGGRRKLRMKRQRMEEAAKCGGSSPAWKSPWKRERVGSEEMRTDEDGSGGRESTLSPRKVAQANRANEKRESSAQHIPNEEPGSIGGANRKDDDDVLDTDAFMARVATQSAAEAGVERLEEIKPKKRKKMASSGVLLNEFGSGGASAWV